MINTQDPIMLEIEQALERLPERQRRQVLLFIEFLEYRSKETSIPTETAPTREAGTHTTRPMPLCENLDLYEVHQVAEDTGIADLADQHDHYLYGTSKHDA